MRFGVAALATLVAWSAWAADSRIDYFAKQLRQASDPRSRAQAALALGLTNDSAAVTPLCGGLGDGAELVRSAAAKSLNRLADLSSLDCLKRHANDPSAEVRDTIGQTIASLDRQQARSGITAVYVFLSPVLDKEDRPNPANARYTEDRLRAALQTLGVTIAPAGESKAEANAVIRSKRMRGFALSPELHSVPPAGLRLSILGTTYPDKSLLGEVSVKASGAGPMQLIQALAPKVIEDAADTFDWSR